MGIFDMKCGTCERSFTTVAARKQHERDKHGIGVTAVVDEDEEIEEAEVVEVFEGTADDGIRWSRSEQRLRVLMRIDVDTDRLYHRDMNVTIAYLKEVNDRLAAFGGVSLAEHWTGYETMQMVFEYHRDETDAEYARRQKWIVEDKARAEEAAREKRARDARMAQYQVLRREFG